MENNEYDEFTVNDELIEEIESCAWSAITDAVLGRGPQPSVSKRVSDLTPTLFAALKLMCSGLPDSFQAKITYDQLAEQAGVSRRTVIRHIETLVEMGMIQKWPAHDGITIQPGTRIGDYLVASYEESVDG